MPTDDLQEARLLYQLAHTLHEQASPRAILKTSLWLTEQAAQAERGCVVIFEPDGGFKDAYLPSRQLQNDDNELWQRLSELVRNGRRTVTIGDLSVDQPWPRRETRFQPQQGGSAVAVALQRQTRLLGVLMLTHPTPLHFDERCVRLLERAADTIAVALDNAERFEMLAASQALYSRLYKDASFPIIITDLRGDIIDANPKAYAVFGYDRQSLMGLPLAAIMRIGREPLTADNLKTAAAEDLELNATARTASGKTRVVRLFARRVRLDNADYLVWVAQDMSAQARDEERRRDLAAMVYHDLRGPLNNINLGLTRVDKLLPERAPAVDQLLNLALGSTRQLTRMVNSLLDLEQLESGRAELNREQVRVADLIHEAVETTRLLSEDAGHVLALNIDPHLPPVSVDRDMMVRVLVNLLENAIKYTPPGGRVYLEATGVNDHARIAISDNGPGIPTELHEKIFDKYVRAGDDRSHSGRGLGLAFCRLAVQAHGGYIWVEDNQPSGACFVVSLRLETESARLPA